jgi:hypothetical protein
MTEPTDYEITEAMIDYGGSFATRWGMLYRSADEHNQARLKAAFEDLWSQYKELVQMRARQESQR